MANRIFRGPAAHQPRTVSEKSVAGAYLPGTFVTEGATQLTQAVAFGPLLRLLADRDFYSSIGSHFDATDPLKAPYAANDTAVAYVLEPTHRYQAAVAAAVYTFGQELTVAASGRLAAAASGDVVVAYFSGAPGAKAAGDLVDVEIANFYAKA